MSTNKIVLLLLGVLSGLMSLPALANTCTYRPGLGPMTPTIPLLTSNISVGADVPNGTVIHRQRVNFSNRPWIDCTTDGGPTFNIDQYLTLTNAPALVPGWSGVYAGALYQTSVPGIGVAITNNDGNGVGTAISTTPFLKWTAIVPINLLYGFYYGNSLIVHFVKTGPISAGMITGAQLPTVLLNTQPSALVPGLPDTPFRVNFSGAISVLVNSCQTPDVLVPMGKYEVSKYFTGKGSATPWVSVPIQLLNCPPFQGAYSISGSPPIYDTNGTVTAGTLVNNVVALSMVPTYGIIDSLNGIMKLDNDPNVATGVGIQIAQGSATNPTPFSFAGNINLQPLTSSVSNINIPFQARYIQTEDTITAGPANSKAVFTVNYY